MPGARFVVDALPGAGELRPLGRVEAAHARARRLRDGDPVVLVDGSGREAVGTLVAEGRRLSVRVASVRRPERAADGEPALHLLMAAVRSERLAWAVEKAAELDARRVTLVVTARTQAFRAPSSLVPRLRRLAEAGAKQSDAARWPEIAGPVPLAEALAAARETHRLVLDPHGAPFPATLRGGDTAILIGPEGGWTLDELDAARAAGWTAVSLPAGKLRAETAAIAAIVLARAAAR